MPIYMKLDGIDGSATAEGYRNWIELSSVQLGASHPPSARQGTLASVSEIVVTKQLDDATVKLMLACANGKPTPGRIDFTRSNEGGQQTYLSYRLENTLVTGFSTSSDGDSRPTESLSLNFTKLSFTYNHQNADGSVVPEQGIWPGSR